MPKWEQLLHIKDDAEVIGVRVTSQLEGHSQCVSLHISNPSQHHSQATSNMTRMTKALLLFVVASIILYVDGMASVLNYIYGI